MAKSETKIGVIVKMDDGREFELFEGDIVRDLQYNENGVPNVISGIIRVLGGLVNKRTSVVNTCPPEPFIDDYITINSMIIDSSTEFDAELTRIMIANITDIGSVEVDGGNVISIGTGSQFKAIDEVIADAPSGTTIELDAGEYELPLNLTKSIKLVSKVGAVLTGKINIGAGVARNATDEKINVVLDGVTLTGDSTIICNNADSFSMIDCVFNNHNLTAKTNPILFSGENPVKLNIQGCTFDSQNEFSYNLLEINAPVATGSVISGNRFEKDCCTHNQIGLYDVVDGAIITINDNYCYDSKNMLRVGIKGDKNVTINMNNNEYVITDSYADYAGLVLVQPYQKVTTSMAGLTININKTTKPEGQIAYLYNGANDMQFTDDNKPTIMVDGVVYEAPIYK